MAATVQRQKRLPTRQRLIDASMELFARQGFAATSVGEIEAAAGLQPRRGSLYNHFPSKEDLLDAGIEDRLQHLRDGTTWIAALAATTRGFATLTPDETRDLILEVGRWLLGELDHQQELTRILEHDGTRVPRALATVRTEVVETGFAMVSALLEPIARSDLDVPAAAVMVIGSLVGQRRTTWTYDWQPLNVDDDRLLSTWADYCITLIR